MKHPVLPRRALGYLRAHPILCLLLSPGIPEYLSSSSPINALVLNPILFVFQLLLNLGLYGPGVLLIREAMIRWKKGWASVLLLGAAYGILEEGIALSTLFNPVAGPVGKLGYFGHWLGVSWIWVAGILSVHMIYSISLPIVLLGLALPETRGKGLLISRKKIAATFTILGFDVLTLFLVVYLGEHFWMGWPIFFGSLATIGILIYLAYKAPARSLRARTDNSLKSPKVLGIVGTLFYPAILFTEFGGMAEGIPAFPVVILIVLVQALFLVYVLRNMGRQNNERNVIAFALGLILPIAVFGNVGEITLPMTLILDFVMLLFFRKLWKEY